MTRLLRLYPRAWRERYGPELRSLLAERTPRAADRFDLVRGAFDPHRGADITPTLAAFIVTPFVAWLTVGGTLLQPLTKRV